MAFGNLTDRWREIPFAFANPSEVGLGDTSPAGQPSGCGREIASDIGTYQGSTSHKAKKTQRAAQAGSQSTAWRLTSQVEPARISACREPLLHASRPQLPVAGHRPACRAGASRRADSAPILSLSQNSPPSSHYCRLAQMARILTNAHRARRKNRGTRPA